MENSCEKGYNVSYELHNVKDFGLPQDRERIVIVGVRKDLDFTFKFPKPTHGDGLLPHVSMEKYGIRDIAFTKKDIFMEKKGTRKDYFSSRYMSRNRIRKWNEPSLQFLLMPVKSQQVLIVLKCGILMLQVKIDPKIVNGRV